MPSATLATAPAFSPLEIILLGLLGISFGYWIFSSFLLTIRFLTLRLDETPAILPPVVFLRPIKQGVPRLQDKLECLLGAARPGDEIILGVGVGDPESEAIARRLAARAPVRTIVVSCQPPGPLDNPKVAKLLQMIPAIESNADHWILSDSELLLYPDEMHQFRHEWTLSQAPVQTAGYHFIGSRNLPQLLDHTSLWNTLWPGLCLKERFSGKRGLDLTLGACTGYHREALTAVGGFEGVRDYLAEDHQLGQRFAASGHRVRLSKTVLTLDSDPIDWRGWWRHQHRVALTYRACAPLGYLGMGLTLGLPWALPLAARPEGIALVLGTLLLRSATLCLNHTLVATAAGRTDPGTRARLVPAALLTGITESIFWLLAWLPLPVWWGTKQFPKVSGGRFLQNDR